MVKLTIKKEKEFVTREWNYLVGSLGCLFLFILSWKVIGLLETYELEVLELVGPVWNTLFWMGLSFLLLGSGAISAFLIMSFLKGNKKHIHFVEETIKIDKKELKKALKEAGRSE